MEDYIVRTRQLKKNYGNKLAINNFDVAIASNNITGLIGKNGSGKTTLMKIFAGQLNISAGEVQVFSENPMDNLRVLQNLVYTYHNYRYSKGLSLSDIITIYKLAFSTFDKEFAEKLLKYFELNSSMKYDQLSQGMASLFNFICGISCRTKLTLLDEPVLGMDVSVRKSVYEILLRDYTEYPRSFIISSHLISEIEGVLSDIILIDNGKLVTYDTIVNIREGAYRIDGAKQQIEQFIQGKDVIYKRTGDLSNFAILRGAITDAVVKDCGYLNLEVTLVRIEDIFVYMTNQNKEEALDCLWEKTI